MQEIKDKNLNCTIHAHEGEAALMLQRLRERSLDLVLSRSLLNAPEMQTHPILDEPLYVALPPGHQLHGRPSITMSDLRNERLLIHRTSTASGLHDLVMGACQQAGFSPNVVYFGGETIPMLLMVQQGLGIAFAPRSFASLSFNNQPMLVPLCEPALTTRMYLVWSTQHALAPSVERIRHFIIEQFGTPKTTP